MSVTLRLSELVDIGQTVADTVVGVGAGLDGTVVAVLGSRDHPARVRIEGFLSLGSKGVIRRPLDAIECRYGLLAQPLAGDGLLVIESRRLRDDANATVFGPDGTVARRFSVGDGVHHALVDNSGGIWVSYFDEGTIGGDPLSSSGLNRFDIATGERTWAFPSRFGRGSILDCYALNVGRGKRGRTRSATSTEGPSG